MKLDQSHIDMRCEFNFQGEVLVGTINSVNCWLRNVNGLMTKIGPNEAFIQVQTPTGSWATNVPEDDVIRTWEEEGDGC